MYFILTFIIGIFIGVQSAIGGQLGTKMNPLIVGLLAMITGGTVSLLLFLFQHAEFSYLRQTITVPVVIAIACSGAIGIIAIAGSALVLPRVGLTTGVALVILGQISVSLIGDVFGISGRQIPITPERVAGVLILLVSIWLINKA